MPLKMSCALQARRSSSHLTLTCSLGRLSMLTLLMSFMILQRLFMSKTGSQVKIYTPHILFSGLKTWIKWVPAPIGYRLAYRRKGLEVEECSNKQLVHGLWEILTRFWLWDMSTIRLIMHDLFGFFPVFHSVFILISQVWCSFWCANLGVPLSVL